MTARFLPGRVSAWTWQDVPLRSVYPTTPKRTAAVAQILVEVGALRITADGAVLMRTADGWTPYTSHE